MWNQIKKNYFTQYGGNKETVCWDTAYLRNTESVK